MKRIAALLMALLLGAGLGAITTAAPAQAAPPSGCLSSYVCLYAGDNYSGYAVFVNATASANLGCHSLYGKPLNNNIQSLYGNYVGQHRLIDYYDSQNCTGTVIFWSTGGAYPNLSSSVDNRISSYHIRVI